MTILKITCDLRSVTSHIVGIHNDDTEQIYVPYWMYSLLNCSEEDRCSITQVYPSIGLKIHIKPMNDSYAHLEDPVSALRNAFEQYSTLISGIDIPLYVNNSTLNVSILDTYNTEPICIRGVELEVIIDEPIQTMERVQTNSIVDTVAAPVDKNTVMEAEEYSWDSMIPGIIPDESSKKFPGKGRTLL
jgi:hypothetical protein